MKKILFIIPTLIQTSGVAAFMVNYFKEFKFDGFNIEVLYNDFNPSKNYIDFFEEKNIKLYSLPYVRNTNIVQYYNEIKKFFYEHHDYEVIYSNASYQSYLFFREAKKYGINKIIMHSHATQASDNKYKNIIGQVIQKKANKYVNYKLACSNLAGIAMFGKSNFKIINNAIDYNKYMYSELHRKKLRTQYHIEENEKVIGYVGRFSPQKNIFFFIELAKKIDSSYKIMMIGKGSLKEEFISLINEKSLADKFVLIDEISNVNEYYSLFDYFFLPSVYEGLPIVGVEAQANGLPCIFSDTISKECKISNNTVYLDRNNVDSWIENMSKMKRNEDLKLNDDFNINVQAKKFEKLLSKIVNE